MQSKREKTLQAKLDKSNANAGGKGNVIKGMLFEQKMNAHFAGQGWIITPRKAMCGYEYDLFGQMPKAFSVDCLLVECKDTVRVSAKDVVHFIHKVDVVSQRMENGELFAYLCFTGDIDPDAKETARINNIVLKRVKR